MNTLWSNNSADEMCDTIVHNSMRIWASAVENFYNSINKDQLNVIIPHTKCWNGTDFENIKYHYGKNFHRFNLLKASINKGERGFMKFNDSGNKSELNQRKYFLKSALYLGTP
ncbi:hypothetical protein BpHYR1_016656 [Brachionus plicatilis]|uniref:Uncharacterized protein n=1 Tax=Brachionus plicatilis TaxID=10195 RepID=A0A3M7RAQ7_BRAPC|nr:hypothetical protein BpHYR1_016656 [Brachionus plicatilis]